jgi:hypothetical protein
VIAIGLAVPQHQVVVELVKAIAGIKQSRAKASLRLLAREATIFSHPGINSRGQQPLRLNSSHGCSVLLVAVLLLSAVAILRPPGRL